jgi:hypothetical protein
MSSLTLIFSELMAGAGADACAGSSMVCCGVDVDGCGGGERARAAASSCGGGGGGGGGAVLVHARNGCGVDVRRYFTNDDTLRFVLRFVL